MSVVFSGTYQGSFTSTGNNQLLNIPTGVDWMYVYNQSVAAANQTTATAVKFYWQSGFANNSMWVTYKSNAANAANLEQYVTTGGFSLYNNTINIPGASYAVSAVSNAQPPVVSTATTTGLSNGMVVRLYNIVGGTQLNGLDFTVGNVISNTSFTLAYMQAIVTAAAGGASAYRIIPYQPYFYPPTRVISNIGAALSSTGAYNAAGTLAIITLTVTHTYQVGQKVRLYIPTLTTLSYGMTSLNLVECTILFVNQADVNGVTNTITVDVNVQGLPAFAWPLTGNTGFEVAQVVPVGENTAQANNLMVNPFTDAEINLGQYGMSLQGGAGFPGGANGNVMFWVAGKSYNV